MYKKALAASLVLAAVVPGVAQAATPTQAQVRHYLHLYHAVRSQDGPAAVGCNLIERRGSCHVEATSEDLTRSDQVLERDLAPAPAVVPTRSATVVVHHRHHRYISTHTSSGSADTGSSSGWAIPSSIVQCESGGQNLPPNGASAAGYYQIVSSTWQANGGGQYSATADGASLADQSKVAARIWKGGAGRSQWVC